MSLTYPDSKKLDTGQDTPEQPYIAEISEYIDDNINNPELTASSIAAHFGLSRARLYRTTQKWGGIKCLIQERRLKLALTILSEGGHSGNTLVNLAYDLGFNAENTFRRAFKKTFGMSPSQAKHSD